MTKHEFDTRKAAIDKSIATQNKLIMLLCGVMVAYGIARFLGVEYCAIFFACFALFVVIRGQLLLRKAKRLNKEARMKLQNPYLN